MCKSRAQCVIAKPPTQWVIEILRTQCVIEIPQIQWVIYTSRIHCVTSSTTNSISPLHYHGPNNQFSTLHEMSHLRSTNSTSHLHSTKLNESSPCHELNESRWVRGISDEFGGQMAKSHGDTHIHLYMTKNQRTNFIHTLLYTRKNHIHTLAKYYTLTHSYMRIYTLAHSYVRVYTHTHTHSTCSSATKIDMHTYSYVSKNWRAHPCKQKIKKTHCTSFWTHIRHSYQYDSYRHHLYTHKGGKQPRTSFCVRLYAHPHAYIHDDTTRTPYIALALLLQGGEDT